MKVCIKSCISAGSPKSSGAFSRNLDQVWHEASISSQGTCRSWGRGEIGRKTMVVPPPTQPTTCPLHRDPASVCVQANTPVCASVCLCSTVGRWAPAVCHLPLLPNPPNQASWSREKVTRQPHVSPLTQSNVPYLALFLLAPTQMSDFRNIFLKMKMKIVF